MKKMIAIVMVALMLLSMLSGCTVADNGPGKNKYNLKTVKEGYLTVLTSPDYAPYEFYALDEKGNPTLAGFDMALAQYIADYLELDRTVVRLIVVLLMVFYGTGLLAYLIAALVMPKEE